MSLAPSVAGPPSLMVRGARQLSSDGSYDVVDIAVTDGKIAAIGESLEPAPSCEVLDLGGRDGDIYVLPGLIDFHVHVAAGVQVPDGTLSSTQPDLTGVTAGVTTVVDAGSLGCKRFGEFAEQVVPCAQTRVLAMLNVASSPHSRPDGGDIGGLDDLDRDGIERACERHGDVIVALKLRLVGAFAEMHGSDLVSAALELARAVDRPLVVHIGDRYINSVPAVVQHFAEGVCAALEMLEAGDAISHVCSPWPGALMGTGTLDVDRLRSARARGVLFDVATGRNHFSAEIARRLREEGLAPQILSTDMNGPGIEHHSLVEAMSRFVALGYPVADVIEMVTRAPATALRRHHDLGAVAIGRDADLTVLRRVDADVEYVDTMGMTFRGTSAFEPVCTVRAGRLVEPRTGPHQGSWRSLPGDAAGHR